MAHTGPPAWASLQLKAESASLQRTDRLLIRPMSFGISYYILFVFKLSNTQTATGLDSVFVFEMMSLSEEHFNPLLNGLVQTQINL